MDLVGSIIEMLNCLMPPVSRHLEHHRNLQENMEELRSVLGDLNNRLEDINLRKQNAEAYPRKVVRREVISWLEKVQIINNDIQVVEEKFQNVSCLYRGCLGKHVQKKIEEVKKLLQQGSFPDDIAIDQPPSSGMRLPTEDARGRTNVKEQIWGYLMEDDVGMIGVCGAGGIGKTTLMKNIHNDLLNESKFDKVIWASVPYPVSVVKLQDNIASNMKQTLFPENVTEEQRAAILSEVLSRVRYALILDDAWGRFCFEDVGIPKPTQQNGCKVVITSRLVELCNYIGCEQVIRMQLLSKEESFNLFLDTVGHDVLMKIPNLEETLKLVVAECAGLPLAIVVIARSMRGENDISTWRYALYELRRRVTSVKGWDDEIFERLKFSYDRLNDLELQNCFLYCTLYTKGWFILGHDLIELWIDNGLIEQLETRKAMYDRAIVILKSLINKCLIKRLPCNHAIYYIKMHDVMRDMALQVAGPSFMAKVGLGLTEVPRVKMENLEKIWLQHNQITVIASIMSPNCPKLSSLDVSWNYGLRQISDSFFVHMIGLKFLNLSGTAIVALPHSISNLGNLTVLRLVYCGNLRYMPSLAKLKALKKLDLKKAGIEKLPQGMEMLENLQHLNLDCPNLVELPMVILCNLPHLQFLAVGLESTSFTIKAEKVIRLKMLETFIGEFDDLQVLNNFVKSFHEKQKFTRYWLRMGWSNGTDAAFNRKVRLDEFEMGRDYYDEVLTGMECTKIIALRSMKIGRDYSELLLNDFQLLRIDNCCVVKRLSKTSLFSTAKDLRYCDICSCEGLECMLDLFSSSSVCSQFDKLEILWLCSLPNLQVLVKVEAQAASAPSTSEAPTPSSIFSNLKFFKISYCPRIKKLFPPELLKGLQNLEKIYVKDCKKVEQIIAVEDEKEALRTVGNNETITLAFPKLRKLSLKRLPKLKSICTRKGVMGCDSLQTIKIYECPMLNRIPLYLPLLPNGELSLPPSLQEIHIESKEWWESLVWDNPSVKDIFLPFLKPYNDHSLHTRFHDLKGFNNFVKSFQGQRLTTYAIRVEATEFSVEATNDDDSDFDFDFDSDSVSDGFGSDSDMGDVYFPKSLTFSGMAINGDYPVLLPDDLQHLRIKKCCGVKSLNDAFVFKALSDLISCQINQFDTLECMLELFSWSSECSPFDRFSLLLLSKLPNLRGLVKVKGQAAPAPSTLCAPTQPTIFSNLKKLIIYKCPKIKKLLSSELLKGLQNLKLIFVVGCAKMEEIIEVEEEKETLMADGQNGTITYFILPKLTMLGLMGLPKLKSICTARGVMVCDSLQEIRIFECLKLKRIPLCLPALPNGVLYPPPSLKIYTESREWWESLVWDNPSTKDILLPFLNIKEDFSSPFEQLTDASKSEDE